MKKMLLRLGLLLTVFVLPLKAQETGQTKSLSDLYPKKSLAISIEDLDFEGENIILNVDGEFFPIASLKKVRGQWIAQYENRYCLSGHPLCKCGNCHITGCRYYVDPTLIHR
jgi:hypothetical protein